MIGRLRLGWHTALAPRAALGRSLDWGPATWPSNPAAAPTPFPPTHHVRMAQLLGEDHLAHSGPQASGVVGAAGDVLDCDGGPVPAGLVHRSARSLCVCVLGVAACTGRVSAPGTAVRPDTTPAPPSLLFAAIRFHCPMPRKTTAQRRSSPAGASADALEGVHGGQVQLAGRLIQEDRVEVGTHVGVAGALRAPVPEFLAQQRPVPALAGGQVLADCASQAGVGRGQGARVDRVVRRNP